MANRTIQMYEYQQILYRLRQGQSIREIAKQGLAGRHKIAAIEKIADDNNWLDPNIPLPDNDQLAKAFTQEKKNNSSKSLALPYKEQIEQWASENIEAKRIHEKLMEDYGYSGSYNSIQRFVQKYKSTQVDLTAPLFFSPGEAAQVDFGKGPDLFDERTQKTEKTWIFVMTLCFSRHQYAQIITHQDIETWLSCHQNAFEWFGGVPKKIIIDNAKCAIVKACYYDPQVQRSYEQWSQAYGFTISACPPREPKKKGRVESGVKFVKNNFFSLRNFHSVQEGNQQLKAWILGRAGNRCHGSTFKKPLTEFIEKEQAQLICLPQQRPEVAAWYQVTLYKDCHVRFQHCRYSAPHTLFGEPLWLKATPSIIFIYHENALVAQHARSFQAGHYLTKPEHLPIQHQQYLKRDQQWCLEQSNQVGIACTQVIENLLTDPVRDLLHQAQGIIALQDQYSPQRLELACKRACFFNSMDLKTVKQILKAGLDYQQLSDQQAFDQLGSVYKGQAQYQRKPTEFFH